MRRWTCLAWSVSLSMSFGVQAAEPVLPPSPQVFGETNRLQLIEFLAPPIPDEAVPPSPINQLAPNDGATLPPMIASSGPADFFLERPFLALTAPFFEAPPLDRFVLRAGASSSCSSESSSSGAS